MASSKSSGFREIGGDRLPVGFLVAFCGFAIALPSFFAQPELPFRRGVQRFDAAANHKLWSTPTPTANIGSGIPSGVVGGASMPFEQYKIWHWGDRTWEGRNEQYNVAICTKAKRSQNNRYELANEVLCLRLAQILRLPIPYGGIIEKDGHRYFASLEFGVAEETLPIPTNSDIDAIVSDARLACGIIAFDAWIVNEDRHKGNLLFDRRTNQVYLIDHGTAFYFGQTPQAAVNDLNAYRDKLVVSRHTNCLAAKITTLRDFGEWHKRIKAVPEHYIRDSINEAVELGLPIEHAQFCGDYLLDRRDRLKSLFHDECITAFPKLDKQSTLFDSPAPFQFEQGDFDYCI